MDLNLQQFKENPETKDSHEKLKKADKEKQLIKKN